MKNEKNNCIACYVRLSREDGDKIESLSVCNQKLKINGYVKSHAELSNAALEFYIDDGYTGTNFDRPDFQRLLLDIENNKVSTVIVKDLSRLGRNMPKVTELIQEYFPMKKVHFIAIDDNIDRQYYQFDSSEDMMMDIKNMFNGFYPKDISKKVRSTFRAKQQAGQFIGAFACYGYKKDTSNHNLLVIDEPAANIVRKIFALYLSGKGQNSIAKILNEENIPCPSAYKQLCGMNYRNGNRLNSTSYWTYTSIRNILRNQIYTGCMVQNKTFRQICKKKAISLPKDKWIIVQNTHEPIIDSNTFQKVQTLLANNTRETALTRNAHIFSGLLKCGDCGRAMTKISRKGITTFTCGSYNRYGTKYCTSHNIKEATIEEIIRNDLNLFLKSTTPIKNIIEKGMTKKTPSLSANLSEKIRIENEIHRLEHKKSRAYDDYSEDLITKDEYIQYKDNYNHLINHAKNQLAVLSTNRKTEKEEPNKWIKQLLDTGMIEKLDRESIVEMIRMIYIFADNRIQIIYNFSRKD